MKKPKRPSKTPTLWKVKRGKKEIGAYHITVGGERVNLRTKDASEALKRRTLALRGTRDFADDAQGAAENLIAALHDAPPRLPPKQGEPPLPALDDLSRALGSSTGAPEVPPTAAGADSRPNPPPSGPVIEPERIDPGTSWHANLADAAASAGQPVAPPPPPQVSNEELAALGVEAQIWVAELYARQKVFKGFIRPPVPDESKAPLAAEWKKILDYADVGAVLPPWVTGLVIPAVTLITATTALAAVFADVAAQQKQAAGVTDEPQAAAA